MNSEASGNDILERYRAVSSKLKKRFLRKPNVTEALSEYTSLAVLCEHSEMSPYAALCWLAAARCEDSLGNIPSEVGALTRAARQFLKVEKDSRRIGCPSPINENVQAALNCYNQASSCWPENSPLSLGLKLEAVNALRDLNLKNDIEQFLTSAVQAAECITTKLQCLELLASHYIEISEFAGALAVFSRIASLLEGVPLSGANVDVMYRCEISRVLLLLILRPVPQRLAPELAKVLEKYTWDDTDDPLFKNCGMSEDLIILMKSLVMSCQSEDVASLPELEAELWSFMCTEQKSLLRTLVKQYSV